MSNKRRNRKHRLLERRKLKETVVEQESLQQETENTDSEIPVFQEREPAGQSDALEVSTPEVEVSRTTYAEAVKPEEEAAKTMDAETGKPEEAARTSDTEPSTLAEEATKTPDIETTKPEETTVPEASVSPAPPAPQPPISQPEEPAPPVQKEIEKNLYLQYNNLEFSDHLMFEAAVNDYCRNTGTPVGEIQAVNLYVKPEEGKAYYVINHDGEKIGSIDL